MGKHLLIFLLIFHSGIVLAAYFQKEELENTGNLIFPVIDKAGTRKFRKTEVCIQAHQGPLSLKPLP